LQAQLKQQQDKAGKAWTDADVVTRQRSAMETELKKLQADKAQLAQQNADLAKNQQNALDTQLKEARAKLEQAQANSDRAASQVGELQTQLKQEQDKAQKAQAEADLATSQRSALETQLNEAREKLGQAQSTQGNAQFSTLEPQPSPEQDSSQKGSEASNPPPSSSDQSQGAGKKEPLKEFVLGYLRTVAINDTSTQLRYFAERVNFYGRGALNSSAIEASTQRYHDEWPMREWRPGGDAKVVESRNPKIFVVYQPFSWTVSDGSRHAHGDATLYLLVRENSGGEFQIVNVHELDRSFSSKPQNVHPEPPAKSRKVRRRTKN
jgi:hypothetical protein